MDTSTGRPPPTLLEYRDPEGFRGFLAYSGTSRPLAAGGLRVQRGLTGETIVALAEAMRLKENVLQLNVDGAKCGIDYDPTADGKHAAMRRFLRWLRPELEDRLSVGPDMGTTFAEIEALARAEGIPSAKAAIARAQGLSELQVVRRLKTLDSKVGSLTVGARRAGQALAHAALAAARHRGLSANGRPLSCALQGFGTLGRGAAATMREAGVELTTIADEHGSLRCSAGIDLQRLLAADRRAPLASPQQATTTSGSREAVLAEPVDLLLLAACEDALALEDVERVRAPIVAVGANNGLRDEVETALGERGILVVPDFIGGAGGSAAMDALFSPAVCPDPVTVLAHVALIARTLVERTMATACKAGVYPREAALGIAEQAALSGDARPYGLRVLRDIARPARGYPCVGV
ncbi:MAG TPA: Glu/Leu/Phe/Val dehydrogenase dimerization domain-containing protein [Solirubrobacteraceae bacterium]|jgi:glutamate dehydrogenase (NAD(P)+)|nr:Glu/Leu/Phe/Val dehydrogenase dimerization domain-containing protein [Solirubrobacteraceae bacterium]